jgi:NAD-dependent DNA ligase
MKQEELEKLITKYNDAYRKGEPLVSDSTYDDLLDKFKELYPDSILLKKSVIETVEPTSRKRKLPIPMFSLEKKKSVKEIMDWLDSFNVDENELLVLTPKFDGCSGCFDEGEGIGYTRGDGTEGQDITHHLRTITSFEERSDIISFTFGEIIMKKSVFEEKYKGKYKSARNMVAGLLNREDTSTEILKDVDYLRYGVNDGLSDKSFQLHGNIPFALCKSGGIDEETLNKLYSDWSKDYQIDGIVIDINSSKLRKQLGRLPNNNPAYAIAYKNPEWSGKHETIVKSIEFNVSKQGKLKPVIIIEPVDIDGVIVERVTGYNAKYVFDNNIAEDSEIEITRSGDVIPKHLKTLSHNTSNVFELMDESAVCPCCGEPTKWDETMTELLCVNPTCKDMLLGKLEHFFSTLEVEDFARPSIKSLYEEGFSELEDILTIEKGTLSKFQGWGETSAENLLKQFRKLKEVGVPLARLFHALDLFEGVLGEKTAQLIIDNSDQESADFPNMVDLCKIKGVAEITAKAFIRGIDKYVELPQLPIKISYTQSPKTETKGDKFNGMKVCFTGVRDNELENEIKANGGEVVSGVSKTTTHLIVKDMTEQTLSSSKSVKAKQLGVIVIDIESFKKL